jgi:hypothetical protein
VDNPIAPPIEDHPSRPTKQGVLVTSPATILLHDFLISCAVVAAASAQTRTVDTFSDTWTATDALGRTPIDHAQAGPPRAGKFVGIFYFLWLGQHGTDGPYNITKILAKDPDALRHPSSPLWGPQNHFHHWGKPLFGYYVSDDAWVIQKHAQMLSDAGVDAIAFDVWADNMQVEGDVTGFLVNGDTSPNGRFSYAFP